MSVITTFDEATNFAFYSSQLENLDKDMHAPISGVSWGKVIKLRPGISLSDESTAFTRINFGTTGTLKMNAVPWITQDTTSFPNISLTGERVTTPIRLAGQEISYTKLELEKAQRLGMNLSAEKVNALRTVYQMGIDKMVFVGDSSLDTSDHKCRGLLNSDSVQKTSASGTFDTLDADQIVSEINGLIKRVWEQTAYQLMPDTIIMPPEIYAHLATTKYSSDAERTILTYLRENSLATVEAGVAPKFIPSVWAKTASSTKKGRIMAYINDVNRVRFSMAPMRKEAAYIEKGIRYATPYIWALGEVEFVYPETAGYLDNVTK